MTRASHRELDYAFGQRMLTLRTSIGLTQAGLADLLGVSRHAIGGWEGGQTYPKAGHLKHLISLALQHHAFAAGHEAEQIRELWRAAHQKVLLDERWLQALLLSRQAAASVPLEQPPDVVVRVAEEQTLIGGSMPSHAAESMPATDRTPPTGKRNLVIGLPHQTTSFVGREGELRAISRMLRNPACRLLTLLGPGGIGKTRLAREVAAGQTAAFADGVAFVSLASVGTPNQIVSAIGDTLGLSLVGQTDPTAHLLRSLREAHMLLVLDNFEHLVEGADLVAAILETAPHVAILATSRERLNMQAEWLFDVDGLAYPPSEPQGSITARDMADLTSYNAVELFVQRAIQIQPAFPLTTSTLTSITRICQHVAGMPLAIELAAAGVRRLPVAEIERQISANLDILATSHRDVQARHRSMRAVFDHSWALLSESERVLFPRLAIFRGGWTATAAEQVAGATLSAVADLVDKSLVRQHSAETSLIAERAGLSAATGPRFGLLDPIREYAMEQLVAQEAVAAMQRAHASYYVTLAEAAEAAWGTPAVDTAIVLLDREHDNMRAALQWARDHRESITGLRLADALWKFWRSYGYASEGRVWLEQLLALEGQPNDPVTMAALRRGLQAAAWLASDQHDYAQAARLFAESMALSQTLGETQDDTDLLLNAARQARSEGHYQRASALLKQALAWHRAQGHDIARGSVSLDPALYAFGQVLRETGLVTREQGDLEQARALFEESLAFHRVVGDRSCVAFALLGLADVARDQGNAEQVRMYGEEGLAILRELGMRWAIGFALNTLALGASYHGDLARASTLILECEAIFRGLQADESLAEVLITVGKIRRMQGNTAAAYTATAEALRLATTAGPRLFVAASLEGLGKLAAIQGQADRSVRLLATASTLRQRMGAPVWPADQAAVDTALATARSILGDDIVAATWLEASEQPPDEVLKSYSLRQPSGHMAQT